MTDLGDLSIDEYLSRLSARTSTPGGGVAAALSGAQGAALIAMVAEFTKDPISEMTEIISRANTAVKDFSALADDDVSVFNEVMAAYRTKDDAALRQALIAAAGVPASAIERSVSLLDDLETLARIGNKNLISDVAIAAGLLKACIAASELNILINAGQLGEEDRTTLTEPLQDISSCHIRLDRIINEVQVNLTHPKA